MPDILNRRRAVAPHLRLLFTFAGRAVRKSAARRRLAALVASLCCLAVPAGAAEPEWATHAKIAGAAVWTGMEPAELDQVFADMVSQHVTVIEADSELSNYLTEARFAEELELIESFTARAHSLGMRVVWYYPALEVITPNGKNILHSMAKDHPEWVQLGLDGSPNVFYGGDGRIHWVEPDAESAWMSPASPYKDYFIQRIRQIAATGVDGVWMDVPLFNDIALKWAGANAYTVARFRADTGLETPTGEDWDDPEWRRWIAWRHTILAEFIREVSIAARQINPEFLSVVETVTMDYNAATVIGLDGAEFKFDEGIIQVWEIDALSDSEAMRACGEDDWIALISMNKFGKGASGSKPSWAFTYGAQVDDAELVMAESLIVGNNPYETKIPEMTTTVGGDYRARMFAWAEEYSSYLFAAESGAQVGLLYSAASRDFVDQAGGVGLFADTTSDDPLWWTTEPIDSAYQRQFLAEYRGLLKFLVHEHIPFDVVVNPSADELASYQTILMPDVEAISDEDAGLLRDFVAAGGHLIATGPDPGGLDEYGTARSEYALADVLGFNKAAPLPAEAQNDFGAGTSKFFSALMGKDYYVSSTSSVRQSLSEAVAATGAIPLSTDADRRVHVELSHLDRETVLQFVNFMGIDGSMSSQPTSFSVSLAIADEPVVRVALTSPEAPSVVLDPIPFTITGSGSDRRVEFDISMVDYTMALVSFAGAQPAVSLSLDASREPDGVRIRWDLLHAPRLDWLRVVRSRGLEPAQVAVSWTGETATQTGEWVDREASDGHTYRYQLIAGIGESPVYSNEVTVSLTGETPLARTQLVGASPNPFNPRTEIRYALAQAQAAQMVVYDVSGRRIRGFDLGRQPAGPGVVEWDGRDDAGRVVGSGTYLVQLQFAGGHDEIRVTLIK